MDAIERPRVIAFQQKYGSSKVRMAATNFAICLSGAFLQRGHDGGQAVKSVAHCVRSVLPPERGNGVTISLSEPTAIGGSVCT